MTVDLTNSCVGVCVVCVCVCGVSHRHHEEEQRAVCRWSGSVSVTLYTVRYDFQCHWPFKQCLKARVRCADSGVVQSVRVSRYIQCFSLRQKQIVIIT